MKSTQKIVAGLLAVAMVLTLVVGLAATKADAATFTRSLTVGSRGDDVRMLQDILTEKGFFTYSGGSTGYFGAITQKAVAAWQASVGISPAVGYFGPISRAALAGVTPSSTVTPVAGCPAGAIYNSITGERCATAPLSTTEGTLDVTLAATPSNNSNVTTNMDVQVYGVTLKAKLGDVKIDRADLKIAVTNSGAAENPGNFINTIKVMDGSTVLKSWTVGATDFVKDSSSVYYIRLSDIGLVVPKDGTKTLVFAFSTTGGIDNNRVVTISGYGTNSLRTSSGSGIVTYYDISTASVAARTHTFVKPGTSTLSLMASGDSPASSTVRVDTNNDGVKGVVMQKFALKSVTGDSKLTTVAFTSTSTAVTATNIYLYEGSTLVDSKSNASSSSFSNLNYTIPKDTTKVFTVKADFPAGTGNGTIASTTVTSVTYEKPNGTTATVTGTIAGSDMYLYSVSPNLAFVSEGTTITAPINTVTGTTTALNGKIVLKVRPEGGTMTVPVVNDFYVNIASSTSSLHITSPSAVTVSGNPGVLAEGVEYTVTIDVTSPAANHQGVASANTAMWFTLTGATSTVNGVAIQQTWGLTNFKTPSIIPQF